MSNKKDTFKNGFILEGPNKVVIERLEKKNKNNKYLVKISHPLYSLPAITRLSSAQLLHERAPKYALDLVKKKQPQIVTEVKKAGRFTVTTQRPMTIDEVAKQKANKTKTKKSKTKSKGGGRTRRRKGKQRRKGTKKKRKRKRKSL